MLINPEKMMLVYNGVKFESFEFACGCGCLASRVGFFAPICTGCMAAHGMLTEERQSIIQDDIVVTCGVVGCAASANFFIEFNFGFEESDVEELHEENQDPMEKVYNAELNFD